jgi:hypothetical protein
MVIVWLVASNLGLWFQAFKQYQWANYFHLYAMAIVTIITWMSGFLAIIKYGVSADFHMGLGATIDLSQRINTIIHSGVPAISSINFPFPIILA